MSRCDEKVYALLLNIDLDSHKARKTFRFSVELSDATGSQQAWIGGSAAEALLGCTHGAFADADADDLDALKTSVLLTEHDFVVGVSTDRLGRTTAEVCGVNGVVEDEWAARMDLRNTHVTPLTA